MPYILQVPTPPLFNLKLPVLFASRQACTIFIRMVIRLIFTHRDQGIGEVPNQNGYTTLGDERIGH